MGNKIPPDKIVKIDAKRKNIKIKFDNFSFYYLSKFKNVILELLTEIEIVFNELLTITYH